MPEMAGEGEMAFFAEHWYKEGTMSGTLFMVATPIGNLEDLTKRAIRIFAEVSAVICEDTRVTSKIMSHLGLHASLLSVHEHTSDAGMERVLQRLQAGESLAYVSDAGTPGVNDPGGKLVARALELGMRVEPIPGPSALTAAISVCGFPMDEFTYLGFVPQKKGRETFFREVSERETPSIFFESTHRIEKTLQALKAHLQEKRMLFIGRELTKMHETLYRGHIDEVTAALHSTSLKGEFVIIVAPASL